MSKIHPDIQALVDLSKPSLQGLSFLLRNKEFWPKRKPSNMSFLKKKITPEVDLSKPSKEGLIFLLRNKDLWPKDFEWDYEEPRHCAMGLCEQVWYRGREMTSELITKALGLNSNQAFTAFFGMFSYLKLLDIDNTFIKPEQVADYLEGAI